MYPYSFYYYKSFRSRYTVLGCLYKKTSTSLDPDGMQDVRSTLQLLVTSKSMTQAVTTYTQAYTPVPFNLLFNLTGAMVGDKDTVGLSDTLGAYVGVFVEGAYDGAYDGAIVSGILTFTVRNKLLSRSLTINTPLLLKASPKTPRNKAYVPTPLVEPDVSPTTVDTKPDPHETDRMR